MAKFLRMPTKLCDEWSEFWALVTACPPYWGVWSAGDTALFVSIWHQKHIRVKLNNGLLTNKHEETDTEFHQIILRLVSYQLFHLKGGDLVSRGLAHVPDKSAGVASLAHVPGVPHPWFSAFIQTFSIYILLW